MPNCSETRPRTMRPNRILSKWRVVQRGEKLVEKARIREIEALSVNPVEFFEQILGFTPFHYQEEFTRMFAENQFTAARWCRQSGKSFIVSALLLWHAVTHPNSNIAIVGPSWRQTKRVLTRIAQFTHKLPPNIAFKPQKTQIHFTNNSTIEAFPNSPETIRGPSFNLVYCFPAGTEVTLSNGETLPIEELQPGQEVLSYDTSTGTLQSKKVLRTFSNPKAGRRIMRITHRHGELDCTSDHKVYTSNRGYVPASQLNNGDTVLYHAERAPTTRTPIYSKKWAPKNLQPTMPQKTEKEIPENPFPSQTLRDLRKNLSSPYSHTEILQREMPETKSIPEETGEEGFVYDIEVQDNHNYFANGILVSNCDEMNFIANDQELYDAILYTLGATNGKFVCSSTPWHTDSIFYKIFNHKDFSDFKTSHVPVEKALEPNGPLKHGIIEKIKTQMGEDPARWRREMQAEWAEDEDVWLTQSLIAQCIGTTKNCGEDLREFDTEKGRDGNFFAGLDLAQTRDFTVLSIIENLNDKLLLRHLKIFQQPTLYSNVLGYVKTLQDRWNGFRKIRVDTTREGPSIINDMKNADINNAEGVNFTIPRKSEMASLLKQRMTNHKFYYPLLNWERPHRGDICTELNVERYTLLKDGTIGFSHPHGTHDDVFWSTALAVYATVDMTPEPYPPMKLG
jgi:hypothetical protein